MESASIPAGPAPRAEGAAPKPARPRKYGPVDEVGDLVIFAGSVVRSLPGSLRYFSEAMRLNALITRRTSILMFVMAAFLGASASNFGFFLLRSLGASDFVGIIPGILVPRQLGPQMFGYVFAGSVCCAIAAELGSAKVQQEVDALESEGVDPMQMLVGTRVIACLLYVPLAAMLVVAGGLAGAFLIIVVVLQGNTSQQFIDGIFSVFPSIQMLYVTVTVAAITIQCVVVACFYGMRTGGGPDAVGNAVARSLGVNLVLLHVVLSLVSLVFYGGGLGLPIGD